MPRPSCDGVAGLYFDFHVGSYSKSFVYTLARPAEFPFFDLDCPLEFSIPSHRNRREHLCLSTAPTEPMQTEHEAFAA